MSVGTFLEIATTAFDVGLQGLDLGTNGFHAKWISGFANSDHRLVGRRQNMPGPSVVGHHGAPFHDEDALHRAKGLFSLRLVLLGRAHEGKKKSTAPRQKKELFRLKTFSRCSEIELSIPSLPSICVAWSIKKSHSEFFKFFPN